MDSTNIDKLYAKYLEGNVNNSWLGSIGGEIVPYNDKLLENRLEQLSRPIVSLEGFQGLNLNNIYLEVFLLLDKIVEYFAGEFDFTDREFNQVIFPFIKAWYFGEVYVAYGQGYVNEELRVIRNKNKESGAGYFPIPKALPHCKWRLYSPKLTDEGTLKFTSLITGISGYEFDSEKMIRVAYPPAGNFLLWFDITKEYVCQLRSFVQMAKLSTTKVQMEVVDPNAALKELNSVLGWEFYFTQNGLGNNNDILPVEYCDIEDPMKFMHGCMQYWAERVKMMGFVTNPTSKAERMTTGEHYKDLKVTSNLQQRLLQEMRAFCYQCKKKFKKDIEFNLASHVQAQGVPKTADDPMQRFKGQGFDNDNSQF